MISRNHLTFSEIIKLKILFRIFNFNGQPSIAHPFLRLLFPLQPFGETPLNLWFERLEAQFELAKISSESTKYNHLISVLDENLVLLLSDLLEDTDSQKAYTELKEALISRLSDSETSKLNKLLGDIVLGDRSPSQFLREIRSLSNGNLTDDILKTLWLQRLPDYMRAILFCNSG